jgi:hypothetical protein
MRYLSVWLCAIVATVATDQAMARGGSASRSSFSASRSYSAPKPSYSAPKPSQPRISSRPSARDDSQRAGGGSSASAARKAAAPAQKSLLDRQGDLPSPKLTETIRQRETSGSGWVSAAFLMMLLSGNDLSASSDRSWVERRLEEAEAEEGGRAVNERTADVPAQVAFRYTGDQELTAGIAVALEIEASSSGKTLVTSCAVGDPLSGGAKSNNGLLRWTPPAEGAHVVTCEAADVIDYRLLYVAPAREHRATSQLNPSSGRIEADT